MKPNVWTPEDADQLRGLRSSGDIELAQLARTFALSEAQILELEGQGDGHFYNLGIKYRTGKRMLNRFGILTVAERQQIPDASAAAVRSATDEGFSISDADREALGLVRPPPSTQALPVHWPRVVGLVLAVLTLVGGVSWWLSSESLPEPVAAVPVGTASVSAPAPVTAADTVPLIADPAPSVPAGTVPVSDTMPPPSAPTEAEVVDEVPSKVRVAAPEVACRDQVPEGDVQRFVPSSPLKGDHYVYLTARNSARVCVRDAKGRVTNVRLSRGEQRSVTGRAPFTVYGTGLSQVRVYFRGRPVRLEASTQQLVLGE